MCFSRAIENEYEVIRGIRVLRAREVILIFKISVEFDLVQIIIKNYSSTTLMNIDIHMNGASYLLFMHSHILCIYPLFFFCRFPLFEDPSSP